MVTVASMTNDCTVASYIPTDGGEWMWGAMPGGLPFESCSNIACGNDPMNRWYFTADDSVYKMYAGDE